MQNNAGKTNKANATNTARNDLTQAGYISELISTDDASEVLFAKVFRVSPAALWVSELNSGIALDVNDSFLSITGYQRDEVIGQTTISLGLWSDPDVRHILVETLLKGGKVRDYEIQFCKKSGEVREGLISAETVDINGALCLLVSCSDITERKKAVEELAEYAERTSNLLEEVSAARKALQSLSRRLLEVQESERRHIARELHDEIGQTLTAIQINIETLERTYRVEGLHSRLQESVALVEHALDVVRNLSLDLRPSLLDDLGLVSALLWYVERQSERTGVDMQVMLDALPFRLLPEVETSCFRVVQEALTNVVKHSGAQHVRVELCRRDNELEATIRDDGVGFGVQAAYALASGGASMGLLGMRERAELAGGRLEIDSTMGVGTTIKLRLPLSPATITRPIDRTASNPDITEDKEKSS